MGDAADCPQNFSASFCTICARHGRRSKLQLCRLNSEEAVYICLFPEVSFTVMHTIVACICGRQYCLWPVSCVHYITYRFTL